MKEQESKNGVLLEGSYFAEFECSKARGYALHCRHLNNMETNDYGIWTWKVLAMDITFNTSHTTICTTEVITMPIILVIFLTLLVVLTICCNVH